MLIKIENCNYRHIILKHTHSEIIIDSTVRFRKLSKKDPQQAKVLFTSLLDQFTKDRKTMKYEKVRVMGKHTLELFGQEWWSQGCMLSTETMTEVMLKDCRSVERRWLMRRRGEQQ